MKLLTVLSVIVLANARQIDRSKCDGIVVNGINYEKQVLITNLDKPYQLALDYASNRLYFSNTTVIDDVTTFVTAYINLKDSEVHTISGINGGFANAIDEDNHNVYFGGNDGLYKLESGSNSAIQLNITDKNIWQMFYKNNAIYFTTYPQEEAYVYEDGNLHRVTEVGDAKASVLALDNSKNVFYGNDAGFFYYDHISKTTTKLGEYVINGFTYDSHGNLYFTSPTGIYAIDDKTKTVTKMARIINLFGAVFEPNGNIIYATEDSIIRLKSTGAVCVPELISA